MQGTTPVRQLVFHYIKDIEGVVIASNMIRLDRLNLLYVLGLMIVSVS